MAGRPNKPWYRASRREWLVKIKGITHRLGPDEKEAKRRFHLLMAGEEPEQVQPNRDFFYASEIADQFQIHLKEERAESTLDWYCRYLDPFKERFLTQRADTLSMDTVSAWVNETWKTKPSRRAAKRAVKAAFRYARKHRGIQSTLAELELPEETNREKLVREKEYKTLLAAINDATLADMIRFVWITGARPREVYALEDRHIDLKLKQIEFPRSEAKGKKQPRHIVLDADAVKLLKPKMGNGRIFRTRQGKPYTKDSVRQRFETLEKHVGYRYCLYNFRHSFGHRMLTSGVDPMVVATLMGHASLDMLFKVYGHLGQSQAYLRSSLKKVK